jgi:hypothetical protein
MIGIQGPWHDFKVLSDSGFPVRRCDSFAGGALFEEFPLLHKSWAAFYFDQSRKFPMKYHIPIRPFETGIPPGLKLVAGGFVDGEMVLKRAPRFAAAPQFLSNDIARRQVHADRDSRHRTAIVQSAPKYAPRAGTRRDSTVLAYSWRFREVVER